MALNATVDHRECIKANGMIPEIDESCLGTANSIEDIILNSVELSRRLRKNVAKLKLMIGPKLH